MITVGAPITIGAPQPDMSPIRSAGRPPIMTVVLPIGNGVGGCGGRAGEAARVQVADDGGRHPDDEHGGDARSGDDAGVGGRVGDPWLLVASRSSAPQLIMTIEPRTVVWPLLDSSTVPLPSTFDVRPWR